MPNIRLDIISIGTLSRNRLWNETEELRTAHATTTLIRSGKRNILVDPGLPSAILAARLQERSGLRPEQIDTIFLTNFRPAHRAGLDAFAKAKLLIHENEIAFATTRLSQAGDPGKFDLAILHRLSAAPDKLADGVDLFPLFGYTPGTCGLLVTTPATTTLIAGDAVPTQEHFLAGQALPDTHDIKAAHESMSEVYEIADLIVPGHDNIFVNPRMQGM